jgi:hypothetical protein
VTYRRLPIQFRSILSFLDGFFGPVSEVERVESPGFCPLQTVCIRVQAALQGIGFPGLISPRKWLLLFFMRPILTGGLDIRRPTLLALLIYF